MKIPELTHSDLISESERIAHYREMIRGYMHPRILRPNDIPVHPSVLEQKSVYSPDFSRKVLASVPDMMRKDIHTIERRLGIKLDLRVESDGVYDGDYVDGEPGSGLKRFKYDEVSLNRPNGIQLGSANIRIEPDDDCISFYEDGVIPLDLARAYALPQEKSKGHAIKQGDIALYTWKSHNITFQGLGFELLARNFAIAFNNLGLQELKK